MTCLCGAQVTAESTEALVEPALAHLRETHPELDLTEIHVRNFLESEDRSAGAATERLDSISLVEVAPIAPDRVGDILRFFDHDAFPDNPAWGSCYCTAYFEPGEAGRPWQENRSATASRVDDRSLTGSLAYVDGKLAGWCNASARSRFPGKAGADDEGICSLVCMAVAPPYRRHGLASRLLDGAIAEARANGFSVLEAYPVRDPDSAAHAFKGSLDLYLRAGFDLVSEDPLVVRLTL